MCFEGQTRKQSEFTLLFNKIQTSNQSKDKTKRMAIPVMNTLVRLLIVFGMSPKPLHYNRDRNRHIYVTLDHIRLPAGTRLCLICDTSHLSCQGRKPVTYIIIESNIRKIRVICSNREESALDRGVHTTQLHIESCLTSHSLNYNSDKRRYGLKSTIWRNFSNNRRQKNCQKY